MPTLEFKYQTLFTCSVPDGFDLIKDFNELIASDTPQTVDSILQTIKLSFENAGIKVSELNLSNDLNYCDVLIDGYQVPTLRVIIRQRPSLVVDGIIYKLEEFDI